MAPRSRQKVGRFYHLIVFASICLSKSLLNFQSTVQFCTRIIFMIDKVMQKASSPINKRMMMIKQAFLLQFSQMTAKPLMIIYFYH